MTKLQFVTSVSKSYYTSTAKYTMATWNLPGELVVYIDQKEGDLDWLDEIRHTKKLLNVPKLNVAEYLDDKTKVRKFWGKSCAQIHAIRNRPDDTRIVWLDADIEQLVPSVNENLFLSNFDKAVAMMKSNNQSADCFESGLVIFNESHKKLTLFANQYEKFWKDEESLLQLWRPYDALVLGALAEKRGFLNLVEKECPNEHALENTKFRGTFKHWINKANKETLRLKNAQS